MKQRENSRDSASTQHRGIGTQEFNQTGLPNDLYEVENPLKYAYIYRQSKEYFLKELQRRQQQLQHKVSSHSICKDDCSLLKQLPAISNSRQPPHNNNLDSFIFTKDRYELNRSVVVGDESAGERKEVSWNSLGLASRKRKAFDNKTLSRLEGNRESLEMQGVGLGKKQCLVESVRAAASSINMEDYESERKETKKKKKSRVKRGLTMKEGNDSADELKQAISITINEQDNFVKGGTKRNLLKNSLPSKTEHSAKAGRFQNQSTHQNLFSSQDTSISCQKIVEDYQVRVQLEQASVGFQGGEQSRGVLGKREGEELHRWIDRQEMECKDRMGEGKLDFERQAQALKELDEVYMNSMSKLLKKLTRQQQNEKDLLARVASGLYSCFQNLHSLSSKCIQIHLDKLQQLSRSHQMLETAFAEFKASESMDAYFLKKMANEQDSKEKRKEIISCMEDFLGQQPLTQVLVESQEDMEIAREKSKVSGVQLHLSSIMNDMNQFKGLANAYHATTNEFNTDDGEVRKLQMLDELEKAYDREVKGLQVSTAKKIIRRYQKDLRQKGVQTWSFEELCADLVKEKEELEARMKQALVDRQVMVQQVQGKVDEINKLQEAKIAAEKQFKAIIKDLEEQVVAHEQQKHDLRQQVSEGARIEESLKQEIAKIQLRKKDMKRGHRPTIVREVVEEEEGGQVVVVGEEQEAAVRKRRRRNEYHYYGEQTVDYRQPRKMTMEEKEERKSRNMAPLTNIGSKAMSKVTDPVTTTNRYEDDEDSSYFSVQDAAVSMQGDSLYNVDPTKQSNKSQSVLSKSRFSQSQELRARLREAHEATLSDTQELDNSSGESSYLKNDAGKRVSKFKPQFAETSPIQAGAKTHVKKISVEVKKKETVSQERPLNPRLSIVQQKGRKQSEAPRQNVFLKRSGGAIGEVRRDSAEQSLSGGEKEELKESKLGKISQKKFIEEEEESSVDERQKEKEIKQMREKNLKVYKEFQPERKMEMVQKLMNPVSKNKSLERQHRQEHSLQSRPSQKQVKIKLNNSFEALKNGVNPYPEQNIAEIKIEQNNSKKPSKQELLQQQQQLIQQQSIQKLQQEPNAQLNHNSSVHLHQQSKTSLKAQDPPRMPKASRRKLQEINEQPIEPKQVVAATVQTENSAFMDEIMEAIKEYVLRKLDEERYKYTLKEYEHLLHHAYRLLSNVRSKFGNSGDVFFNCGVFLAQCRVSQPGNQAYNSMSVSRFQRSSQEEQNSNFIVKVKSSVGGANNFKNYSEKKRVVVFEKQNSGLEVTRLSPSRFQE